MSKQKKSRNNAIRLVRLRTQYGDNLDLMAEACRDVDNISSDIPRYSRNYSRAYKNILRCKGLSEDIPYSDLEKAAEVVGKA